MKTTCLVLALGLIPSLCGAAGTVSISGTEMDIAEASPIYQKYEIVCNVCSAMERKSSLESGLKKDMQYAKKYGVINYGRRDSAVQSIKRNDYAIIDGKKQYLHKYSRKFNKNECKSVNTEDCEGALFEISAKILGKVPWEDSDIYPKP